MSAAAGLLAACQGSVNEPAATDPAAGGIETPSKLGKVASTKMGDVATPPVLMGEVSAPIPGPPPEHPTAPENRDN